MRKYYDFANDLSGGDSGEQQPVTGDAELFLKKKISTYAWGTPFGLNKLPIVLYEEVAKVMAEYAASQPPTPEPAGELYWKQRCEAAEMYINELPYKGTNNFEKWQQLKKVEPQQNQDE